MFIHLEFVLILQHWQNSECVESLKSSSRLNQLIIIGIHLKQRHTPISQLMYQKILTPECTLKHLFIPTFSSAKPYYEDFPEFVWVTHIQKDIMMLYKKFTF